MSPYRFKCATCDQWHEGLPDLSFNEPAHAAGIAPNERGTRLFLTPDTCVVDDRHFFIRCRLVLPVKDSEDSLGFGVWSSLGEENFMGYQAHRLEDISDWEPMFGYLSNRLPDYPETLGLKLAVQTQGPNIRPLLTLEPTDHPLAVEQREGIALERALNLAGPFLHR